MISVTTSVFRNSCDLESDSQFLKRLGEFLLPWCCHHGVPVSIEILKKSEEFLESEIVFLQRTNVRSRIFDFGFRQSCI